MTKFLKSYDGGLVARLCSTLVTPWTIACQAPLSMGFSRQKYWKGLPHPPPEDLPDSETELTSLTSPALAGRFFTISATHGSSIYFHYGNKFYWTALF